MRTPDNAIKHWKLAERQEQTPAELNNHDSVAL